MERILIIGCGGAGKSTFSKKMAKILNYELIHLDSLFWNPNWVMTDRIIWDKIIDEEIKKEQWIMDGNFNRTLDKRIERADTIIYFDFSRYKCLYNACKRVFKGRVLGEDRTDMAKGCKERFDYNFMKWIWNFNKINRQNYIDKLEGLKDCKNIVYIRSYKEADSYLDRIRVYNSEI